MIALCEQVGDGADSDPRALDACANYRERLGDDDPLMSKTERHLARLYLDAGRREEAEPRCRSALTRLKKTRPDNDLDVGRAMSELGGVLLDRRALHATGWCDSTRPRAGPRTPRPGAGVH